MNAISSQQEINMSDTVALNDFIQLQWLSEPWVKKKHPGKHEAGSPWRII